MALDTRIQLQKLEIFCRVVELESVTRAANELFITQPVVTSHIRTLQDRLGAKLMYREGHSMKPTEAGQLAYDWAKEVLIRSQEMSRRIEGLADGSRGSAAVATSMTVGSYLLPPLLTRFRAERPLTKIGLDMFDPEHVVTSVEAGVHDFGVLIADRKSQQGSLAFEQVAEEEFLLVAAPDNEIPAVISRSGLAKLQLVASPYDRVREHLLTGLLAAKGVDRGPIAIELGHAEAMKRVVKESDAVSFLFKSSVIGELERGELRRIKIRGVGRLPAPIYLAYREAKNFSTMQQALVAAIRSDLAGLPELALKSHKSGTHQRLV
jgi:DNA-binding transcriptional LysR family regulator